MKTFGYRITLDIDDILSVVPRTFHKRSLRKIFNGHTIFSPREQAVAAFVEKHFNCIYEAETQALDFNCGKTWRERSEHAEAEALKRLKSSLTRAGIV